MPLDQKFYSLKNVRFTLNSGVVADATEVQVRRTIEKPDRTAGSSNVKQRVMQEHDAIVNVKGWNSDDLTLADLTPGARISAMTLLSTESGTPSLLQSDFFTLFAVSGWAIGDTDTSLGAEPSQWNTEILPNVLAVVS